jgi:hypothetical protein
MPYLQQVPVSYLQVWEVTSARRRSRQQLAQAPRHVLPLKEASLTEEEEMEYRMK